MAKSERQTVFEIKGMRELLRALNKIPKELQNDVRDASQGIATDLVAGAKGAASTPLQNLAATGLKAKRDRVPVVSASGSVRAGVKTQDIFYGAEFGGRRRPSTMQFLPHKGQQGYFLYPTARARGKRYFEMWAEAIDKAFRDWDYTAR